jgi:hypothetical protein
MKNGFMPPEAKPKKVTIRGFTHDLVIIDELVQQYGHEVTEKNGNALKQICQEVQDNTVKTILDILKNEWYALNDLQLTDSRDIAINVGKKANLISMINRIHKHYDTPI